MSRARLLGLPLLAMLSACSAMPGPGARAPAAAANEAERTDGPVEADAALGRSIAQVVCARCHALEERETGPHPAAPPFPRLARKWPAEILLPRLEEGIRASHPDMPEVRLAPAEIDPFLAFWSTL